jgi:hypothetical protein
MHRAPDYDRVVVCGGDGTLHLSVREFDLGFDSEVARYANESVKFLRGSLVKTELLHGQMIRAPAQGGSLIVPCRIGIVDAYCSHSVWNPP